MRISYEMGLDVLEEVGIERTLLVLTQRSASPSAYTVHHRDHPCELLELAPDDIPVRHNRAHPCIRVLDDLWRSHLDDLVQSLHVLRVGLVAGGRNADARGLELRVLDDPSEHGECVHIFCTRSDRASPQLVRVERLSPLGFDRSLGNACKMR